VVNSSSSSFSFLLPLFFLIIALALLFVRAALFVLIAYEQEIKNLVRDFFRKELKQNRLYFFNYHIPII
jgi:hypothetical protein